MAPLCQLFLQPGPDCPRLGQVNFIENDQLRALRQRRVEQHHLLIDHLIIAQWVGTCPVKQVDQNAAAFDMAQKVQSQPDAVMGPLQQPGNIGKYDLNVVHVRHAQVGHNCRERIVGDFRLGLADHAQQCRLARVRHAYDPRIGYDLQLQRQPALFAYFTVLRKPRRPVASALEGRVAPPASTSPRDKGPLFRTHQVGQHCVALRDTYNRPDRHWNQQILAGCACLLVSAAMSAPLGAEMDIAAKGLQRVQVRIGNYVDIAAASSGPSCRPALRHEFLAPERDDSVPPGPRLHMDFGSIKKHFAVRSKLV